MTKLKGKALCKCYSGTKSTNGWKKNENYHAILEKS
jgi:hypothetical protein